MSKKIEADTTSVENAPEQHHWSKIITDCFGPNAEFKVVPSWVNEFSEKMGRRCAHTAGTYALAAGYNPALDHVYD
jgi:hypothetical protein